MPEPAAKPPTPPTPPQPGAAKPKRKRLSKACDACHKSKRRCDGTAPCSNCYFADKECVYTNAAGRLISAPRPSRPAGLPALPAVDAEPADPYAPQDRPAASTSRKRARQDSDEPADDAHAHPTGAPEPASVPTDLPPIIGGAQVLADDVPLLQPNLVHELVNLFFAHCHPHRLMFHRPHFNVALAKNRVPAHLLYAICGLSARHSRRPAVRGANPSTAAQPFSRAAHAALFDAHGRLRVPADASAVRALVLLEMADFLAQTTSIQGGAYELAPKRIGLALQMGQRLMQEPPPARTDPDAGERTLERECVRRAVWLCYVLGLTGYLVLGRRESQLRRRGVDTSMRLPLDETRFELAELELMDVIAPEYLAHPAVPSPYASEFGHWIRITTIAFDLKEGLSDAASPEARREQVARSEAEAATWAASLPEQLCFTREELEQQLAMFETSSNAAAWCYCMFHVVHLSTVLALDSAKATMGGPPVTREHWAAERLKIVVESLGTRARNSPLKGIAIFPLYPLYGPSDPTLLRWQADVNELWDVRIVDLASQMDRMGLKRTHAGGAPAVTPEMLRHSPPAARHGAPARLPSAPSTGSQRQRSWDSNASSSLAGPGAPGPDALPPLLRAYDAPASVYASPASSSASASSGAPSALSVGGRGGRSTGPSSWDAGAHESALPPSLAALKLPHQPPDGWPYGRGDEAHARKLSYSPEASTDERARRWRSQSVSQGAARPPNGMAWLLNEPR